jgi:hypothetical protein
MFNLSLKRLLQSTVLLAALVRCLPVHGALSCSNGTQKACNGAATCAQAYSTNPTAGDLLVVSADVNTTSDTLTIASTLDGAWTAAQAATSPVSSSTTIKKWMWFVKAVGGGADTVTISGGDTGHNIVVQIVECSGFSGTATEDQGKNNSGGTGVTPSTGTTSTTTHSNEVVMAALADNNSKLGTPSGYTAVGTPAAFSGMYFLIVSSAGTQLATSTGGNDTGAWVGLIDTFFDAGAGAGNSGISKQRKLDATGE